MHIAIDGTPAINDIRAIQRYTGNLIRELSCIDHENLYSILCLGCKTSAHKPFPDIDNSNFNILPSDIPGKLLKTSWALTGYPKFSSWTNGKADLIHFPGGCTYIPTSGENILTTLHGFHQQIIPQFMNPKERSSVLKHLGHSISKSNHFITVSEINKQELMQLWGVPENRITAIPLGISPEFSHFELSKEQKSSFRIKYSLEDKSFLLYVGALEPHKNIEGIITSYSILGNNFHNSHNLILIGAKTAYFDKYRDMVERLNISAHVIFIDYITPGSNDLAIFYNLAELLVFPSFYEGWTSPPLESMKCGTPALVSDIPSLKESTGGTALYCNPNAPSDIADKIRLIHENSKLYESLRANGMTFANQYTWRRCSEKTLELYQKLTSADGSR